MILFSLFNHSLPITNPTWIFLLVMVIILLSPIIFARLKIPHIIGLILAGILIGSYGFNILERDSSFELFGRVGLYYIMFLAGLEMDMEDFRKHSSKGVVFGIITFIIPMVLGIASCVYILHFNILTSILLASMFASHTLVAYPVVSRYGLSRERSVTITIGGTAVAVTLALLVLAVISGMHHGTVSLRFWISLVASVAVIAALIIFVFPRLGRWFFRKYNDSVMQYVFVLALVFLGGGLMDLAGMEGILGAFLVGMAINPLVPKVSPLMNRIEFVGNAIFIPYFLIGVGMMIDVRCFIAGGQALTVALVMTAVATGAKWLSAFVTQKIYGLDGTERKMIFGLSNAQAAATLAAALIGHSIILPNGQPLINEDVMNGTVVMILFTCVISSIVTERAAKKLTLREIAAEPSDSYVEEQEKLLIPVANPDNIENLMNLALIIRDQSRSGNLVALNIVTDNGASPPKRQEGLQNLQRAAGIASAVDVEVEMVNRYDMNVTSGIIHTIREYGATDLILGLHRKGKFLDSFLGSLTGNLLKGTNKEVIVARMMMPINTVTGMVVLVPARAEFEAGFAKWIRHLCRLATALGCKCRFYCEDATAVSLNGVVSKSDASSLCEINVIAKQPLAEKMTIRVTRDQLFVVVSARSGTVSYDSGFIRLPALLNKNYHKNNLLILYPEQTEQSGFVSFSNPIGQGDTPTI